MVDAAHEDLSVSNLSVAQRRLQSVLSAGLLLLIYFVGAWLALFPSLHRPDLRAGWPASGLALAGVYLCGWWFSIPVLLLDLCLCRIAQMSWNTVGAIALGNCVTAVFGAWLLKRPVLDFRADLSRVRDVVNLAAFGIALACAFGATLAAGILMSESPAAGDGYVAHWADWWCGTSAGALVFTPFLLVWYKHRSSKITPGRSVELVILTALTAVLSYIVFSGRLAVAGITYRYTFPLVPLGIWAAMQFHQNGGTLFTFLVSALATWATSSGNGPFHHGNPETDLLMLQSYVAVTALTCLCLAAAIMEREHAQEALRMSEESLRALSARIETAREEERMSIAREIHDELGQQLTGLKMLLSTIVRRLYEDTHSTVLKKAQAMSELIDETITSVRRLATELRPGMLDDLGLLESLQWQAQEFTSRTGIECSFNSELEALQLNQTQAMAVFRIFQEALTNIARHAEATKVDIDIDQVDEKLVIEIRDNGRGIQLHSVKNSSLGLIGMRERAKLAGGALEVLSIADLKCESKSKRGRSPRMQIPGGTLVRLLVPTALEETT